MGNTFEGVYTNVTDEEHTYGVLDTKHKNYRTWVYNRINNEMISKVVSATEAQELYSQGWRLTPAEFTADENLKGVPAFEAMADDMAQRLNFLLNIDECDDIENLREFATMFLMIKIAPKAKIETIRNKIKAKAKKEGFIE